MSHYQKIVMTTKYGFLSFASYGDAVRTAQDLGIDTGRMIQDREIVVSLKNPMEGVVKVLRAIPKGGKGSTGSMQCPACTAGIVTWVRSSYNGHLRVHCSTPDCVRLIQ